MTDEAPFTHSRSAAPVEPGELSIASRREGDTHTITLTGELDIANAGGVEQELIRVEGTDARAIVVDLSGVTFMDSIGIRLLLLADARSRADSDRLAIQRPSDHVRRVLRIAGVAQRLPFAD